MRAILFDLNGVLVNDEPIHQSLTQEVLAEEGVELSDAEFGRLCLGRSDRAAFAAVLEEAAGENQPALVERLVARKAAYYRQRIREDGYPPFPGAVDLVREAADDGCMLGVVSGARRDEMEEALDDLGIRERFKTLVSADDVESSKPDPEGYVRGLRELSSLPPLPSRLLHPHEVVAIEDTPAGLEAARAAGLATLGVAHTFPADHLTGADHVAEAVSRVTLSELRRLFPG